MMSMRGWLVAFGVLCFPSLALANTGTPLMWASALHLVVGNALIGLIEGLLLGAMFKCSKRGSVLVLIAANYVSAWAGAKLLSLATGVVPGLTIETIQFWFWVFVAVAFVVTLVIEFPFFWYALRPGDGRMRKALVATPVIHGVSYLLLVGWYWLASGTSMLTQLDVVTADEMALPDGYALYYLETDGESVLRIDLADWGSPESVAHVSAPGLHDRLFVNPRDGGGFDLMVYRDELEEASIEGEPVLADFAEVAPLESWVDEQGSPMGTWWNFGSVPAIGEASDWRFFTGCWAWKGIRGENLRTGEVVRFGLELPIAEWRVRNATQLPGDYVVAQLGRDQIVAIDVETRRISLLARGQGPVVVVPKASGASAE
ncbi:hypothetical protein [Sulfuriroseicoccus oceanibius]|uniref:Uncharacterized protein n=1 Tax=Sulfuriroseicoccus oceanibius TaxID=2707525 RepID=A0A6B3L082_9BACT|nr:hypothetical protein [Sulfuriroseicoccus oceanibius]QQL43765.1 hypothetical protein G3M56_007580 [Sulfuriroseicoccus oceanibius]